VKNPGDASLLPKCLNALTSRTLNFWVVLAHPGTELTASYICEYTQNAEGSQVAFSVLHRIMNQHPLNVKNFTYTYGLLIMLVVFAMSMTMF
jgi:hypothetical protein